ncbi:hypothetical protein FXO38_30517 [Capsicum annuum]|nr:hypothetical protein FXO38_30517 [Capsicum annuum]
MSGMVGELLEQSKHFGVLLHDLYESEECLLLAAHVHVETSKQNLEKNWMCPSIDIYVKLCLRDAIDGTECTLGRYEAIKMHDLLREIALRITNDKPRYMVRAGIGSQEPKEQDWAFDLDKVSFYDSKIKGIPEDMTPNCPTLSTFFWENLGIVISSISAFHKIVDTLLEKVLDFGLKKFKSISDFIENMETLERNVKQLSDKALDVKTEVENRKRSGKKKRNRVVDSWFDEVIKVEEV